MVVLGLRAVPPERSRERLLDAAAEVFTRLGFRAATVDDVAGAAGYTKGAVYSLPRQLRADAIVHLIDPDGRSRRAT